MGNLPRLKNLWFAISLYLWSMICFGQEPIMYQFGTADGLPSATVYQVIQHSSGWLWMVTEQGVCRYNGFEFERFGVEDGLPDNEVFQLFEDSKQRIWFLTANGKVGFYSAGKFFNQENTEWLAKCSGTPKLAEFLETENGDIWLAWSISGIVRIRGEETTPLRMRQRPGRLLGLNINSSGEVIALFNKLNMVGLDGKRETHIDLPESLTHGGAQNFFRTMAANDGRMLASYGGALLDFGTDFGTTDTIRPELLTNTGTAKITAIDPSTQPSRVWLSTWDGAHFVDVETGAVLKTYLKGYPVTSVAEDTEGNTWFSTQGTGVFMLPSDHALTYDVSKLSPNPYCNVLESGPDGKLWIGMKRNEIATIENDVVHSLQLENAKDDRALVKDFEFLPGGDVVTNSDVGVYLLDGARVVKRSMSSRALGQTDDKLLIIAAGVAQIEKSKISEILTGKPKKLYKGRGVMRLEDVEPLSDSLVLTASYTNVYQYNPQTDVFTPYLSKYLSDKNIIHVERADSKDFWFSTNGFGVFKCRDSTCVQFTTEHGLLNNSTRKIHIAGDGTTYVASSNGISIIDTLGEIFTYRSNHTFLGGDVLDLLTDKQENLWVGTSSGLVKMPIRSLYSKPAQIPMHLRSVSVNGVSLSDTAILQLKYDENNLDFEIDALHFRNPDAVSFQYKLVGAEDSWHSTTIPKISYPLLPPGEYALTVRTAYNGFPMDDLLKIPFAIQKPFWFQWWFILLVSLLSFALIVSFVRWRVRQVELAESIKQEALAVQRKGLRSQMNPHFLFNSLNSIQDFITKNDERSAHRYLSKFSRLMRMVLHRSEEDTTKLAEEVEHLKLYLELEQLRLDGKFDFNLTVDDTLDSEKTRIPTMLVQPFVENAIWHGIAPLSKQGLIDVKFYTDNQKLFFEVDDNGVGRKANLRDDDGKKSKGIQKTFERVALINPQADFVWDIIDKGTIENPEGTKIIVGIPLSLT